MTFEKRTWFVIDAFILFLVLLTTRLIYWQMVHGNDLLPTGLPSSGLAYGGNDINTATDSDKALKSLLTSGVLQDLPQPIIQRLNDQLETITRGSIYDRNGNPLAVDQLDAQGNRVRFYSDPSLANVIGSISGLGIGISGLEHTYNTQLLGFNNLDASLNRMLHLPVTGDDLILTIDSDLQRKAQEALAGRAGSITVLDAHTGAILAMASQPHIDPNRFLEEGYLSGLLVNCNGAPQCSGVLLNRATQALYIPGSTWKTVTLIAALDSGDISPDMVFDFGKQVESPNGPYYVYQVDGGVISDPNHTESRLSLEMSYAKSANAAFARIGNEMSPGILIDYAARFGFSAPGNKRFPFEFDFSPAQLANNVNSLYSNNLLRAVTAIGQGELLTSPLNMGMVIMSVYNNGEMPLPYLVYGERNHEGSQTITQPERVVIHKIMKPETAQIVRRMMETVVTQGSGGKAAIAGVDVGGKTGTAQVGGDLPPHAWFTGFAQDGDRAVVVVVMIENGGEGSQVAAPIFANIAAAALHLAGTPVQEPVPVPSTPAPTATENAPVASPGAPPAVKEATLAPEDIEWFRMIRKLCATPLAMGELLDNPHEWRLLIEEKLVDFVRMHVSAMGGITPARNAIIHANVYGIRSAWHGPGDTSPVGHAANLHLDLWEPNFGIQEWCRFNQLVYDMFPGLPEVRKGYMYPNDKPGLGIDLDEALAARYPCRDEVDWWTQTRLPDGSPARP